MQIVFRELQLHRHVQTVQAKPPIRPIRSIISAIFPLSVAESFLNVGNLIVRCQDTSRARVQVVKPLVGDLSVAHVLNPGDLLPCTL